MAVLSVSERGLRNVYFLYKQLLVIVFYYLSIIDVRKNSEAVLLCISLRSNNKSYLHKVSFVHES